MLYMNDHSSIIHSNQNWKQPKYPSSYVCRNKCVIPIQWNVTMPQRKLNSVSWYCMEELKNITLSQ